MRKAFSTFFLFCFVIILSNCATAPVKEKSPPPPAVYRFEFNSPEKAPKKADITIGIVAPKWDDKISGKAEPGKRPWFDVSINPQPVELLRYPDLTAHVGPVPRELYQIAGAFNNAIKNDFEGMIIARGFNTMGPFSKVDDMTYPQKTACNLIIIPEFSQMVTSKSTVFRAEEIEGTAIIRTEIVLNIYEPLSREKLWMKRFSVNSEPFPYRVEYAVSDAYDQSGKTKIGIKREGVTWDNRPNGYAEGATKLFKEFMQKSWDYFSPEEMIILKKHSDEIREKKRF